MFGNEIVGQLAVERGGRVSEIRWTQTFRYRDRQVVVARSNDGWQLTIRGRTIRARTLIGAFEELRGQHAADPELEVVVAALALDRPTRRRR